MKSQIALIVLFLLFAKVEGTAVRGSSECNNYRLGRNNDGPFNDFRWDDYQEQLWRNALALCTGCLDIKPKSGENEFKEAFGENKKWIGCQWSPEIDPVSNYMSTKAYIRSRGENQKGKRCRMIVKNETSEEGLILPGFVTKKDDCPYMEKFKEARRAQKEAKTRAQKEAKTRQEAKTRSDQQKRQEAKTKQGKGAKTRQEAKTRSDQQKRPAEATRSEDQTRKRSEDKTRSEDKKRPAEATSRSDKKRRPNKEKERRQDKKRRQEATSRSDQQKRQEAKTKQGKGAKTRQEAKTRSD